MFKRLSRLSLLAVFAIGSLTSCQGVCTLVGCESGIRLMFSGNVPVGARVTISSQGQQPVTTDCPPNIPCPGAFFPRIVWSRVTVTVQTSTSAITKDFNLTYHDFKPNGSGCGPTCSVADVEMVL
jgi:hypothetical protein